MFKNLKSKLLGKNDKKILIKSPLEGEAVSINTVNDPTFSEEMLGKGIAIRPRVGKLVAPIDGEISVLFDTKHAVAIKGDNGVEILMHIGLETVNLKGKYFTSHAEVGQKVKAGDLLIEFEIDKIKEEGYEMITPIVICNTLDYKDVEAISLGDVDLSKNILEITKN